MSAPFSPSDVTMDNTGVTLMEVYRLLTAMRDQQGESLDGINAHLASLNSKVATHERLHAEGNVRMKNIEREVFGVRRVHEQELRRSERKDAADSKDGIVIKIPTDSKTITALVLTLAAILVAAAMRASAIFHTPS